MKKIGVLVLTCGGTFSIMYLSTRDKRRNKMLTESLKNKFRKLAQDGLGDDVLYLDSFAWIIFRISTENAVCVRQNGGTYDFVKVNKI